MLAIAEIPRIAVFGPESYFSDRKHGSGLWAAGIKSAVEVAEAEPVLLGEQTPNGSWENILQDMTGVILAGYDARAPKVQDMEECAIACRKLRIPILAIDHGMHAMNSAFGGTLMTDIAIEAPDALQHRHPPNAACAMHSTSPRKADSHASSAKVKSSSTASTVVA